LASAFTHALVGLAAATAYAGVPPPRRLAFVAAACAVLPDADAIGFQHGVPYGSFLGHRGFTHSLVFALVTGLVVTALAFRDQGPRRLAFWCRALFLAAVTASHGVLDAATNGGLGVAFFSPFTLRRYFFPFRPIAVSPIRAGDFFGERALRVLASEARWVWLPTAVLLAVALAARRWGRR
jgi:inner membrane protein